MTALQIAASATTLGMGDVLLRLWNGEKIQFNSGVNIEELAQTIDIV